MDGNASTSTNVRFKQPPWWIAGIAVRITILYFDSRSRDFQDAACFGTRHPSASIRTVADGRYIAFFVRQHGQTLLYVMQADGANTRIVADSLDLLGAPAWASDGRSITSAADDHGVPRLFRVPVDGRSPVLVLQEYAVDPTWAPDGRFVVYSGPDIGATFSVKAATAGAAAHPLPALTLSRGGSAPHLPAWRTRTRVPARRYST